MLDLELPGLGADSARLNKIGMGALFVMELVAHLYIFAVENRSGYTKTL